MVLSKKITGIVSEGSGNWKRVSLALLDLAKTGEEPMSPEDGLDLMKRAHYEPDSITPEEVEQLEELCNLIMEH